MSNEQAQNSASNLPDWCHVGAKVAIVVDGTRQRSVKHATITKIGKRDIVLDNGERFNASRRERSEGGTWGWVVRLADPSDQRVLDLKEEIREVNRQRAIRDICHSASQPSADVDVYEVIARLAHYTDVKDELRAILDARS